MSSKKELQVIIVDDERLARNALRSLLEERKDVRIIAEADTVPDALEKIETHKPDLIFLDIQMPGATGFDLVEKLTYMPHIIFVTAYDQYAVRAFEINALDYLVKPVGRDRLAEALSRVHEEEVTMPSAENKLAIDDRLFIQFTNRYLFLRVSNIVVITATGDYSDVKTADGQHGLTNKTMQEWEKRLPENTFVRIHRSSIINLDYVERVEEWFQNSFRVFLTGIEEPVIMSRRYAAVIKSRLG